MKRYSILLLGLIFCVGVFVFIYNKFSTPSVPTPVTTSTPITGIQRVEPQKFTKTTPYVKVNIEYPKFVGDYFNQEVIEKVNVDIKDHALDGIDDFIAQAEREKGRYEAITTYRVAPESESLVQIYFKRYTDTGGAHGISVTNIYKVERGTGKVLGDADVFVNVAKLRKDIYDLIKDQVIKRKIEKLGMSQKEAEESWKSFTPDETRNGWDSFAITEEGIEFWFSPYSIGAYVEGEYNIVVPYAKLTNYLNPNYK